MCQWNISRKMLTKESETKLEIQNTAQSSEKKKAFVNKVLDLMESEGLTALEANAIPTLLEYWLKKNNEQEAANRMFVVRVKC